MSVYSHRFHNAFSRSKQRRRTPTFHHYFVRILCITSLVLVSACVAVDPSASPAGADGSTATQAEVTDVELWHSLPEPEAAQLEEYLQIYFDENPDVQVESLQVPASEVLTRMAAGAQPDIILAPSTQLVEQLALNDSLLTLEEVQIEEYVNLDAFLPNALDSTMGFEGRLSLPLDTYPIALLINREHAEAAGLDIGEPPTTGDEFLEWAQALTTDEQFGFLMGGSGAGPSVVFGILGKQWDLQEEAPQLSADVVNEILGNEWSPFELDNPVESFLNEEGSMIFAIPGIATLGAQEGVDVIAVPVPVFGERFATLGGVRSFAFMNTERGDDVLQAAARTVGWLSNNSNEWTSNTSALPVRDVEIPEHLQPYYDSLLEMRADDFLLHTATTDEFIGVMDQLWAGEVTVEEALEQYNESIIVIIYGCCCFWLKWCGGQTCPPRDR